MIYFYDIVYLSCVVLINKNKSLIPIPVQMKPFPVYPTAVRDYVSIGIVAVGIDIATSIVHRTIVVDCKSA